MPRITITGSGRIPGAPGRKALHLFKPSGVCYYGFQDAVTASTGIPLPDAAIVILDGSHHANYAAPVALFSTGGAVDVVYQELF
jgi:hypothetical protein